jgi:hypothetical protein
VNARATVRVARQARSEKRERERERERERDIMPGVWE